ncbi:GNAT family N-acetyltransferase [Eubacteriales bacterium OttesenSCG-928-M02]|nr:GNAT family N-acetyltransferase [Eubacteriales bacterium OttesenSCG-928-M02]
MQKDSITIRHYKAADATQLFSLLEREGEEWGEYWQDSGWQKYQKALEHSIVYVLVEGETLCGYVRLRDDDGYGVYIYDLLVDKAYRGKEYGRLLMERACVDFPHSPVYVLGDVYPYYEKLGYEAEGTIYIVRPKVL